DGATVTTNPGSGITHPGWFGVTPPGSQSASPCRPMPHNIMVPPVPLAIGLKDYYFSSDNGSFAFRLANIAEGSGTGSASSCASVNSQATALKVDITVDDPQTAGQFLQGVPPEVRVALGPGASYDVKGRMLPLLNNLDGVEHDRLYGVRIDIKAYADNDPGD